jgi:hypothetical protein
MIMEEQIFDALVDAIETVTEVQTINSDRIFLATTQFRDHEFPAVQIWDVAQSFEHQRGRVLVNWAISVEIIMKSLVSGEVSQKELWELRHKIQKALWAQPNLGIPGVVHLVYTGNVTDLHTIEPHYIARIDFDVVYYDDLTGSC